MPPQSSPAPSVPFSQPGRPSLQVTRANSSIDVVHPLPGLGGGEWAVDPLRFADRQGMEDEECVDEVLLGVRVLKVHPRAAKGQTGDAGEGEAAEDAAAVRNTG